MKMHVGELRVLFHYTFVVGGKFVIIDGLTHVCPRFLKGHSDPPFSSTSEISS